MPEIVPRASTPALMYDGIDFILNLSDFFTTLLPFLHPSANLFPLPSGSYKKENISSKIGLILSFSLILIWGARLPVVRFSLRLYPFLFRFRFSVKSRIYIP